MDDSTAEFRARKLVSEVKPSQLPVPVAAYVEHVGAVLKVDHSLGDDEPGWSFEKSGKHYICVNGNDSPERRRFTACHELAHIYLGLPSDHQEVPSWSSVKRSPNEIYCDIFAAELLLPVHLFQPLVRASTTSLASIDAIAKKVEVSFGATGSRYAVMTRSPCAFVFSERGIVRYASRSASLREARAWVSAKLPLPADSASDRARKGEVCDGPEEVDADVWFSDWQRGGTLLEEARHLAKWDQTLTLLWFEDEDLPAPKRGTREEEEETGLRELDGNLPWPGKSHRR